MFAQQPSDKGHHKLEQPEVKGQSEDLPGRAELTADPQADRKGITAKGHGNQRYFIII
jgi:hypothetical protein